MLIIVTKKNMEKVKKFCEFEKVYSEVQEKEIDKEFKRLEGECIKKKSEGK